MKSTIIRPTTFAECMDIFDWFNDDLYEYLNHIFLTKLDADARVARALPCLIDHAAALIAAHAGTEEAYPIEYLHQPA